MKLFFIVLCGLALLITGPWLIIFSLNTLFPVLGIPFTFKTWASALILGSLLSGAGKGTKL